MTIIPPRSTAPMAEMVDGKLKLRFHPGQSRAWASEKRFVLVLAGSRSGKTSWSPTWLWREMKRKGPGDYLYCAPSFKLLDKAGVPYLNQFFNVHMNLGEVKGGAQGHLEISQQGHWTLWGTKRGKKEPPSRIIFGHADDPYSLEAAQYKAAVCDEAGIPKFKAESWEAIQRRLAIDQGRCLFPTTPYQYGWLKTEVYDRAVRYQDAVKRGLPFDKVDADYDVISFESIMNPAFPLEEWERARRVLPAWKFDLFYRGIFSRPAGSIFDCFDENYHKVPGGYVPDSTWRLFCGIDFGAPNFAAVFLAEEPGTGKLIAFAEYRPQESKHITEHINAMHALLRDVFTREATEWSEKTGRPRSEWTRLPDICVGGAMSEGQWRAEFNAAGWPIMEPDQREVEVGIGRVFAAFQEDLLFISEDCPLLIDEVQNYSREVDEQGEPISDTIMDKNDWHGVDSFRYIVSYIKSIGPVSSITWI